MKSLQNTVQTRFWGECVLQSLSTISEKKDKETELIDRKKMYDLFEMVDDYIEQT